MQSFKDNQGREWKLSINGLSLDQVEQRLGVSFSSDPKDEQGPILKIATDSMFAFKVAFLLCEDQTKARGIEPSDFADALVGDALDSARRAILDGLIAFPSSPEHREAIARVVKAVQDTERAIIRQAMAGLDGFDAEATAEQAIAALNKREQIDG